MTAALLEPLELSVVVPLPPDRAFRLFTSGIAVWWPVRTHSIGEEQTVSCAIEPRAGGEVFETQADGTRASWGRVLVWEPPHRFACSWYPGHTESEAQQVEVDFHGDGDQTRVVLRHYGWEALGEKAAAVRNAYRNGWKVVFGELYPAAAQKEAQS
jgi:uncharacterized protein YndB with AHSA1/START domain